jgi:hypothetical protein
MMKRLLLFTFALAMVVNVWAQTAIAPTIGDGSESSPWEIETLENLYWLTQNSANWGDYFIQIADIDASESATWTDGFTSIGYSSSFNFTGNYNGQGYKVTGAYNNGTNDYLALFGYTDGAVINDVHTFGFNLAGDDYVAGLIAYANETVVTNCSSSSDTVYSGDDWSGALIAYAKYSTIINCIVNDANITANDYYGAGLIGSAEYDTVVYCSVNTSYILGNDDYSGGLIAYSQNSVIKNNSVIDTHVNQIDRYAAVFIGYSKNDTINNCHVSNSYIENGNDYAAIFVGYLTDGGIDSCSVTNSTIDAYDDYSGGFVGQANSCSITNSYCANVTVNAESGSYAGGFAGRIYTEPVSISNCYSDGYVTGKDHVGGFGGYNYNSGNTISNSYSTATVSANNTSFDYTAGFVGRNKGTITNCYSIGTVVTVGTRNGPFVGYYDSGATINNSYYSADIAGVVSNDLGESKTAAELTQQATFAAWDFSSVWNMSEGNSYPALSGIANAVAAVPVSNKVIKVGAEYNETIIVSDYDNQGYVVNYIDGPEGMTFTANTLVWTPGIAGVDTVTYRVIDNYSDTTEFSYVLLSTTLNGEGTVVDPFQITSVDDLLDLSTNSVLWQYNFIQTTDIDASSISNFSPIGNIEIAFTGSYAGEGNSINNLLINTTDENAAFIGVAYGASIEKLSLINCNISGSNNVGALVAVANSTTIDQCYTSGSVSGEISVGGFVAESTDSDITNCYTTASVSANNLAGGFVAVNSSNITYCYASGMVSSFGNAGAFVCEHNSTDTIGESFYCKQTTDLIDTVYAVGLSVEEMQQDTTYGDWDITDIWTIAKGQTFPRLKALNNTPIVLHNTVKFAKVNAAFTDYVTVISMDNTIAATVLDDAPQGMTLTDYALVYTPKNGGKDTVTIKTTDINGLTNKYTYVLTSLSLNGEGTIEDPFQILTSEQLLEFAGEYSLWNKNIVLTNNIDAATITNYTPAGSELVPFSGTFNGKGYAISNLTIYSDTNYVGLFAYADGASIDSLGIKNCTVTGKYYTGGIVGYAKTIKISNSFVTGAIEGTRFVGGVIGTGYTNLTMYNCSNEAEVSGEKYIGGLAGQAYSGDSIVNCFSSGNVYGMNDYIGGFAGECRIKTKNSYCTGNVTQTPVLGAESAGYNIGGLYGYYSGSDSISNCYTTGDIKGETRVAAFIGSNYGDGEFSNCYATGNVYTGSSLTDDMYSAAFIGYFKYGSIKDCYASGKVFVENAAPAYYGGLIAYNKDDAGIFNSFFNTDLIKETSVFDVDGTPLTTTEMMTDTTYADWSIGEVWGIKDNMYPALLSFNNAPVAIYDSLGVGVNCYLPSIIGKNIYDFESASDNIFYTIENQVSFGTISNNYYYFNSGVAENTMENIVYRVGELTAAGDTLWGNKATLTLIKIANTAPVLSEVASPEFNENTSYIVSINDVTASDAENDKLYTEVIGGGFTFTVSGDTIIPKQGFYGNLSVQVTVTDGEMYSDTLPMTLTVVAVPDTPVVTWESPESTTYGSAIGTDIMNAQTTASGTFAYSFTADSIFNAGTYLLVTEFTPTNELDFTTVSSTVNYTVDKTTLIATADSYSMLVGSTIPELTINYSGFVNGESENVLDVVPLATTTANALSGVGTYDIIVSEGSDNNYNFEYVNGMLTIEAIFINVSVSELSIDSTGVNTATFDITSNTSWTVVSSESWLTVNADSGAYDASLALTAEANLTNGIRTAVITVSAEGVDDKMITVTQSAITGVNDISKANILVYPNPASDVVNVSNAANTTIRVFDITGQLMYTKFGVSNIEQINLSGFNPGVYTINISNLKSFINKCFIVKN